MIGNVIKNIYESSRATGECSMYEGKKKITFDVRDVVRITGLNRRVHRGLRSLYLSKRAIENSSSGADWVSTMIRVD